MIHFHYIFSLFPRISACLPPLSRYPSPCFSLYLCTALSTCLSHSFTPSLTGSPSLPLRLSLSLSLSSLSLPLFLYFVS